jgi:hypothetical protein
MNMRHLPLVASATLALLLGAGATPASAACDPATHAIQYLHSVQMADGSIDGNVNETADYVLGSAADGIDPNTLTGPSGKSAFDYFTADLGGAQKSLQDANVLGKLIQAVVAGHHDPHNFGGINLINRLRSGSTPGGSPQPYYDTGTGVFLDALSSGNNQTFAQANAILGLAAGDLSFTVPIKALTELKSLQSTSGATKGGWAAFGTFDSNDTSMALMALAATGHTPSTDTSVYASAFTYLLTQQDSASGGFTFSTDFGTASDPDSDSFVIQALLASGEDPVSAAWTNAKGNAPTDVLTFQDATTGGFPFEHGKPVQAFATTQAVVGLRHTSLPVTGSYASGTMVPAAGCATVAAAQAAPAPTPRLPAAGRPGSARDNQQESGLVPAWPAILLLTLALLLVVITGGIARARAH